MFWGVILTRDLGLILLMVRLSSRICILSSISNSAALMCILRYSIAAVIYIYLIYYKRYTATSANHVRDIDGKSSLESQRREDGVKRCENVVRHEEPAVAHAVLHLIRAGGGGGVWWADKALGIAGRHVGGREGVGGTVSAHG